MNNKQLRNSWILGLEAFTLLVISVLAVISHLPASEVIIDVEVPMTQEIPLPVEPEPAPEPADDGNRAPYFVYIGADAV